MNDWTSTRLAGLFLYCAGAVAVAALIFAIVFGEREQRHHDLRPAVERARAAAVEIIADGVEEGVRRATKE